MKRFLFVFLVLYIFSFPLSSCSEDTPLAIRDGIYLGMPIQSAYEIEGQPPAQWSAFAHHASYDFILKI